MQSTYINIADFSIRIDFKYSPQSQLANNFRAEIQRFFNNFVSYHEQDFDVLIKVTDFPNLSKNIQILKSKNRYILFYKVLSKNNFETYYQASIFQFQIIIQNILYDLLSNNNGFLLHSSASEINQKAYIFCGKSGAGKSTSVKMLSERYPVLSDDFSIIRSVKKDQYLYYQHPFVEKNSTPNKTNNPREIGKIFFIRKSRNFKLKKTDKNNTIQLLIQQLITPNNQTLRNLMKFGEISNDFFFLYFSKDQKKMIEFMKVNGK